MDDDENILNNDDEDDNDTSSNTEILEDDEEEEEQTPLNEIGDALGLNDVEPIMPIDIFRPLLELLAFETITNEAMTNIINDSKTMATAHMGVVCVECINVEIFEKINAIHQFAFSMKELIQLFLNSQNQDEYTVEDSLKYLYTYILFYRDDLMENYKTELYNFLCAYFKEYGIRRHIQERINITNEDVKVVLKEEDFNNLEKIKFENITDHKECGICLMEYEKEDVIIKLNCNHCYHQDCIKTQLCSYSSKCPTCKFEVNGEKEYL